MAVPNDVIKIAKTQVGTHETGNNHQKYSNEVPSLEWSQNQPWCATFVSWLFHKAKADSIAPCTASCLAGVDWFKKRGKFSKTPKVGDWVFYGPGGGTHVELVIAVTASTITTIGGNTSGTINGKYYNGDSVAQKVVYRSNSRIYGYGHPLYKVPVKVPGSKTPKPPAHKPFPGRILKLTNPYMHGSDVKWVQEQLNKRGYKLDPDGEYGPKTRAAVKSFQEKNKLANDGEVGPKTWAKL